MPGVTPKSFTEGSTFPENTDKNLLRVYSMRFCPYAQRTRLTVKHLKLPHEEVNINLKSKPDWFLARNPLGLVPVLEQGEKIVYDSAICNEYLNEVHGNTLLPKDPYEKARVKILMDGYAKVTEKYYAMLTRLKTQEERDQAAADIRNHLMKYEAVLKTDKYFGGAEPGLLDFHIWPFIERFPAVEQIANVTIIQEDNLPRLANWIKTMKNLPAVQQTIHPIEHHVKFVQSFLAGTMPDYDIGL